MKALQKRYSILLLMIVLFIIPVVIADEQDEEFDQFQLPLLQINESIEKVNIIKGFALSELNNFYKIPSGSIIDHSTNDITRVFDSNGKQILIANDFDSAKIATSQGEIPASKILQVPSDSFINNTGKLTHVYYDHHRIFTVVNPTDQNVTSNNTIYNSSSFLLNSRSNELNK